MFKILFTLAAISILIAYFYKNPDNLPWILDESQRPIGYAVYTESGCGNFECSRQKEIYSIEECEAYALSIYDSRKTNPTINIFEDKAFCHTECFRRTDGTVYGIRDGLCKTKIEVELGGF